MTDHRRSEVMKQPMEKVRVTMDVESGIDVAIAVGGVARGVYVNAAIASTLRTVIHNSSTLAIASAWPAISENDADQGEPYRLRRS